ncbi:hypothetical protein CYMTET_47419 [Cymbomonas tetramitiformis]|uniref:Uncharacterized protein n=1 Tax=Cymbomonas tetramitiformis TaxID=36881 RepID=A0AAE0EXR8_9CHLO|nr:hypothetical protein CYMTET_47419 [Cymbomonas tetramitiformis]
MVGFHPKQVSPRIPAATRIFLKHETLIRKRLCRHLLERLPLGFDERTSRCENYHFWKHQKTAYDEAWTALNPKQIEYPVFKKFPQRKQQPTGRSYSQKHAALKHANRPLTDLRHSNSATHARAKTPQPEDFIPLTDRTHSNSAPAIRSKTPQPEDFTATSQPPGINPTPRTLWVSGEPFSAPTNPKHPPAMYVNFHVMEDGKQKKRQTRCSTAPVSRPPKSTRQFMQACDTVDGIGRSLKMSSLKPPKYPNQHTPEHKPRGATKSSPSTHPGRLQTKTTENPWATAVRCSTFSYDGLSTPSTTSLPSDSVSVQLSEEHSASVLRTSMHAADFVQESISWHVTKDQCCAFTRKSLKEFMYKVMGKKAVVDRLKQRKYCPFTTTEIEAMSGKASAAAHGGETDQAFIKGQTRKLMKDAALEKLRKEAMNILTEDYETYCKVCRDGADEMEHMRRFPVVKLPNGKTTCTVLHPSFSHVEKPSQPLDEDFFTILKQKAEQCVSTEFVSLYMHLVDATPAFAFPGGKELSKKYGPSLKKLQRIAEKTYRCYKMDFHKLTDIVRCSLVYDRLMGLCCALDYILEHIQEHGFCILRVKNRLHPDFDTKENGGYRDVSINVVSQQTGHVCEIQLHWLSIFKVKIGDQIGAESGHRRYIRCRDLRLE